MLATGTWLCMTGPQPEPTTRLDEVRRAHNAVAVFPSLDDARRAVLELERAGFSDEISLLGARREDDEGAGRVDQHDPRPWSEATRSVTESATIGAAAGGVLGAAASFMIPAVGPVIAAGLWAGAGAATGGFVGGVNSLGDSAAWRESFRAVESGNVVVGVHSDDEDVVDRGCAVLEEQDPLTTNRFTS